MTWPLGDPRGALGYLHVVLALILAAAYAAVLFTPLRELPLRTGTRVFAVLFFASCAITYLASAAGLCASAWMILAGLVQLVSLLGFTVALCRQWSFTRAHRKRLECVRAHERGGEDPPDAEEPPW